MGIMALNGSDHLVPLWLCLDLIERKSHPRKLFYYMPDLDSYV